MLAARLPRPKAATGAIGSGVSALDGALGGGLPLGSITEIVSEQAGSGGELILGALLESTRAARLRIALVDASDGFAPRSFRPDVLKHLVWVRPRSLAEALSCTDVLVRDGNYAVLVLDLRGVSTRLINQQPHHIWHRLRLAAEQHPTAVMIQTEAAAVRSVPWRLLLAHPLRLSDLRKTRGERLAALTFEVLRGQQAETEWKSA